MDSASLITTPRGSWILTPTLPMFVRRRNLFSQGPTHRCVRTLPATPPRAWFGHRDEPLLISNKRAPANSRHHCGICSSEYAVKACSRTRNKWRIRPLNRRRMPFKTASMRQSHLKARKSEHPRRSSSIKKWLQRGSTSPGHGLDEVLPTH
jgi:hypothetical protein